MKNNHIQGIRGIAALVVFVSHVIPLEGTEFIYRTPFAVFIDGGAAVMLFFLMSGYFAFREPFSAKDTLKALLRKIVRIYPAYVICLLLGLLGFLLIGWKEAYTTSIYGVLAYSWSQSFQVKDFLIQCLMFVKTTDAAIVNPPVWTMLIEMRLAILLPFLYLPLYVTRIRDSKLSTAMYYAIVLTVCQFASTRLGISLFYWITIFVTGGCLHLCLNQRWFCSGNLKNVAIYALSAFAILLMGVGRYYAVSVEYKDYLNYISTLGTAMLLAFIMSYPKAFAILECKWLVFIGDISYYFYLIHWVVLSFTRDLAVFLNIEIGLPRSVSYSVYTLTSFAISLIVASGLKYFVSRIGVGCKILKE